MGTVIEEGPVAIDRMTDEQFEKALANSDEFEPLPGWLKTEVRRARASEKTLHNKLYGTDSFNCGATGHLAMSDAVISDMRSALFRLTSLVEKAGGPIRLSMAVQLGAMSWCSKFNEAYEFARELVKQTEPKG